MVSEVYQALTAGRAAIDSLKMLNQYADEVKDSQKRGEFMRLIGELSVELAETQIRLAERMRENHELKDVITDLQKEIESLKSPPSKPLLKKGLYYSEDEDGPFCTSCYDDQSKLIRVVEMPQVMRTLGRYKCPKCNAVYGGG
ncbi:hypothetical protein IQ265_25130 [Nodosilinea sp. LEGE 06152]|uniref:hypothetical protein n=1 Tax=Nodosilinea sp. LEGE 06152 TaxID=2777966 RepID=UPI001881755B|nr:hypothetical protein [Nodosilinea sp. LEGE 06152]MBE9160082.1 hypothetical protein [Nodosilinea sp. LEGE 06152]